MEASADYRRVFEASREAQLLLDSTARLVSASDGYLRTIGKTRTEIEGRSIFDLPPYAGAPAAALRLREALHAMQSAALPISAVRLGGDEAAAAPALWVSAKLLPITDSAGRVEYVVHALESTPGGSERTESDSERRLRKLIEQTYDTVALFDAHGRVAYVSPTIQRVLGYTEQEFSAMNPVETVHPDDRARFGEELNRLFANPGGLWLTRFRAHHRDGHVCTLESASVNRLHDPDVNAVVTAFRDVTKQTELEDELRRSSERLQIALTAARAMSWDIDLIANRSTYSRNFGEFFGVDPSLSYDTTDALLGVHPDDRERIKEASRRCIELGEPFDVEHRGANTEGETRWFASHGQLSRDASGQALRMIGVTWDISERQRMLEERRAFEQRMQESQKLESLGVLAGGIAHDFSNLLMVVIGNVSLLRRELGEAHPTISYVEQVEEASRRATDLCRQLLAYAGKGRFVLQDADLNRLIEETMHLLQISISKKAALRLQLEANLPAITADATQVRQVLMNLVINASDAIGEHSGTISIRTGVVQADRAYLDTTFLAPDIPAGNYVYVEVSDTGTGMNAATQARIFEPFFTTKFTGRGLGLAAVLGIVRGHKGALKVYSEPGKGSSFKFLLPAAVGARDEKRPLAPRTPGLAASGTILVVDDEPAVRAVAGELLERIGFRILSAADGVEAIRVYQQHQREIVCVLMDLTMPNLDGEEAFRELRRIDPEVRVLLMSGYNEQDAGARFIGKGVAGFIQKPFSLADLEQSLHWLMD